MITLFENEKIAINIDNNKSLVEINAKQIIENREIIQQLLNIVKEHLKNVSADKIVFRLDDYYSVGDETVLFDDFIPFLGGLGVKTIAIVRGNDQRAKIFFEELGNYLNPVKKQYDIQSKQFQTKNNCYRWIDSI